MTEVQSCLAVCQERLLDRPTVSPMAPFGASGGAEGGASRASGRVGGSESDTRLAGERDTMRDEMTRLMHSASQPKTDLRHAFYVDPQQQMSKHHLHSEDLDSESDPMVHTWFTDTQRTSTVSQTPWSTQGSQTLRGPRQ